MEAEILASWHYFSGHHHHQADQRGHQDHHQAEGGSIKGGGVKSCLNGFLTVFSFFRLSLHGKGGRDITSTQ